MLSCCFLPKSPIAGQDNSLSILGMKDYRTIGERKLWACILHLPDLAHLLDRGGKNCYKPSLNTAREGQRLVRINDLMLYEIGSLHDTRELHGLIE